MKTKTIIDKKDFYKTDVAMNEELAQRYIDLDEDKLEHKVIAIKDKDMFYFRGEDLRMMDRVIAAEAIRVKEEAEAKVRHEAGLEYAMATVDYNTDGRIGFVL